MEPVKRAIYFRLGLLCLFTVALWIIYIQAISLLKEILHATLTDDQSDSLLSDWILQLYPRLSVEKHRFSETFFQLKVQQVALRMACTVQLLLGLWTFWPVWKKPFHRFYALQTGTTIDRQYIVYLTAGLYVCMLLVCFNAIIEFKGLFYFRDFYQPVGIGKLLLPVFPSMEVLWMIYIGMLISLTATVMFRKWHWGLSAAIFFIYYQLLLFGFGKYDHGFSTLTYALLIFPFFLWEKDRQNSSAIPAWPIVLIQWMICLSYFYGGLEKLTVSGLQWFMSDNLQQHLLIHDTSLGKTLAGYPGLCKLLSFAVVCLQCSFIFLPFYPSLKKILLPGGILFHFSTWLLLGVGGWFNPWWGVYLFFLFPLQRPEKGSDPA